MDLPKAFVEVAESVQAIEQLVVNARRGRLVLLFTLLARLFRPLFRSRAAEEGDLRAVWRPGQRGDGAFLELRERLRLAAVRGDQIDLGPVLVIAVARVGNPGS